MQRHSFKCRSSEVTHQDTPNILTTYAAMENAEIFCSLSKAKTKLEIYTSSASGS